MTPAVTGVLVLAFVIARIVSALISWRREMLFADHQQVRCRFAKIRRDTLKLVHAKPSPELTAVEVAERDVLFSAELLHKKLASESIDDEDTGFELDLLNRAVEQLLAERAKAGR